MGMRISTRSSELGRSVELSFDEDFVAWLSGAGGDAAGGEPKEEHRNGTETGDLAASIVGLAGRSDHDADDVGAWDPSDEEESTASDDVAMDASDAVAAVRPSAMKLATMRYAPDAEIAVSDADEAYGIAVEIASAADRAGMAQARDYALADGIDEAMCPPEEACAAMAVATAAASNGGRETLRSVRDAMAALYTDHLRAGYGGEWTRTPLTDRVSAMLSSGADDAADHSGLASLALGIAWELDSPALDPVAVDALLAESLAMTDSFMPAGERFAFGPARSWKDACEQQRADDEQTEPNPGSMPREDAGGPLFAGLGDGELLRAVLSRSLAAVPGTVSSGMRAELAALLARAREELDASSDFDERVLGLAYDEAVAARTGASRVLTPADFVEATADEVGGRMLERAYDRGIEATSGLLCLCVHAALSETAESMRDEGIPPAGVQSSPFSDDDETVDAGMPIVRPEATETEGGDWPWS